MTKKILLSVAGIAVALILKAQNPVSAPVPGNVTLPNGWSLSPVGKSLPLGDLPLNMAVSSSGKWLAVTNNGNGKQSISLIDAAKQEILHEINIAKSWYGIQFSKNEQHLYVSGGNDNIIYKYSINNNKLQVADSLILGKPWPKNKISPTGIALDDAQQRIYVVTKEDNALYILNTETKQLISRTELGAEAYSCVLSPDKKELYISLWGADQVAIFNTTMGKVTEKIAVQSHPNEIIIDKKGRTAYVANANDNSVSVIDMRNKKVTETISASLYPTKLTGSTTNGLALSKDEKTLYIANADNNCLAVFDVAQAGNSRSMGFIPTGWYPTNVKVIGKNIYVSNGKGFSSMPNPQGPQPVSKKDESDRHKSNTRKGATVQYIGSLFKGTLSIIETPNMPTLGKYSKMVYQNVPFRPEGEQQIVKLEPGHPIPQKKGDASPIKHVFYIIKENRTYDQVLGDMKEGNGDSTLCIFPEKVSPNHHALAREFVLLDNFYVDAEVSADGHNWSTAAYATDYTEKTWPSNYSGRGGTYDYEGTRKIAYPRDGYIWDHCKRAGISYRSYGEFADRGKTSLKALEGNICTSYPGFDMNFKDIDREKILERDLDSLIAINKVAQFNTIRLSSDHTSGMRLGKLSPTSCVADNDLALGRFVEYLSKSSIWKESAIFVLEDDAQNGPDHVDAHRSIAYVISPYTKRNTVDHSMYSTSGMLRTIELILGMPPMSQYDAAAKPMFNCFGAQSNLSPYQAKINQVSLDVVNTAWNNSAKRSAMFNLAKEDSAPDLDLNEVIWKSVKGEDSIMPAPRRSAFIKTIIKKDDD